MATRLDPGQIQLRSVGGAPMQQVGVPQVDVGMPARAEAQYAGTLAQVLDRMSEGLFREAAQMRQAEGLEFVANNPITPQQLQAAKEGITWELGGRENLAGLRRTGNIYDEAVRKARSLEIAGQFEIEGRNELTKLLTDIQAGNATSEQVAQKIATMTNGYGMSLAKIDPDAAIKFRATMATHGNTVLNAAYESEVKRAKAQRIAKFDADFDNGVRLLEATVRQQPEMTDQIADVFRRNILTQSVLLGDKALQTEYSTKFESALRNAKISVISSELMNEAYLENPRQTEREIRSGEIRSQKKLNPVLSNLIATDGLAVEEILKRFRAQYAARQSFIESEYKDANHKADAILQQIYMSRDPAQVANLFNGLVGLPVSPEKIKAARTWIDGDSITGPQRDDLEQLGDLNQRVSLGIATQQEIINSTSLTRRTKEQMLSRFSNVTDDIGAATRSIERSVGIFSAALPPELPTPQARALAVKTRNENVGALYEFARTLGPDGKLPSPPQIRAHGDMLAEQSRKIISEAFVVIAPAAEQEARMMLQELSGVNLLDEAAVTEAFKKAAKRGAQRETLNSARDAVNRFRDASAKSGAAR